MAGPQTKKKKKQNKTGKTSHFVKKHDKGKYHDQVHDNLKHKERFKVMPKDEDLPGEGQHYCISCDKYFTSDSDRVAHFKSKLHKRRLKAVLEEPHTHQDAEDLGRF